MNTKVLPAWANEAIEEAYDLAQRQVARQDTWPDLHTVGPDGQPAPFHRGQQLAWESERKVTAVISGTQSGKTSWCPFWLRREIYARGPGDYLAVTSTFDLFKLKMLPAMREVFEDIYGEGRYWPSSRILEIADPETGQFKAQRADDPMWARIILRSADSSGGLESSTAKGAVLDEAGQDRFTLDAVRAIRRRLALYQGRTLITSTLYNLGWVVSEVITPAEETGEKQIERIGAGELEFTDSPDADIALIQFDSIINPVYPESEYEAARASLPDDEFALYYRGRVAQLRSLIYDAFDRKLHVVPPFVIPTSWKRYLGLDFGGVNTVGLFYAEEPDTGRLFCYREYKEGRRSAAEHAAALIQGEVGIPFCVGGSKSEGQWRIEFAQGGLPVLPPDVNSVDVQINRVYAQHKKDAIVYFDDLTGVLDEKGRFKRQRDRQGEVTDKIENEASFHHMAAERYLVSYLRPGETEGEGLMGSIVEDLHTDSIWTGEEPRANRWKRTGRTW